MALHFLLGLIWAHVTSGLIFYKAYTHIVTFHLTCKLTLVLTTCPIKWFQTLVPTKAPKTCSNHSIVRVK